MVQYGFMKTICALVLLALVGLPAFGGDEQFNGRWDIKSGGARAWWLEIEGAGTPNPRGRFVSAFAGDLNVIEEIAIQNGELTFGWVRNERPRGSDQTVTRHLVYKARLAGEKLEGTFQAEGESGAPVRWTGVRAPEIADKDDGSWKEAAPIELFNGKDLSGWHTSGGRREGGWTVKDGVLASIGGAANLVSDRRFWNFKLHVEYKVGQNSNSGIGLRARYEVQILEDYGREPNAHTSGALYSRIPPRVNASKPAGEWQAYDIRLVGRQVTVVLNGQTVIEKGFIEGLTAMASDADEGEPGPLSLQGDHGPVDFRKITLTPLVR